MTSIIKQFDARGLKYTFASSIALDSDHKKEYGVSKDKAFYSQINNPSYWQITFPIPVTAQSYQFRPYRCSDCGHVESWNVSISNENSLKFLQSNSLPSRPSGAAKFSFQKPVSFRSFRISRFSFVSVGEFDLFGQIGAINRATINYGLSKQKIIRNTIILMMQLTTC